MSTTTTTTTFTTTTLVGSPSAMTNAESAPENRCSMCGGSEAHDSPEAQRRILELEGHVQELTQRAAVNAGKIADYEEEVHRLRSSQHAFDTPRNSSSLPPASSHTEKPSSPTPAPASPDASSQISHHTYQSRLATLTSLLPYRRGSATPTSGSGPTPCPSTSPKGHQIIRQHTSPASTDNSSELQDALTREQGLRKAAETQLTQANTELEELTVQLFSQANEMVAQERKARAKLEERVAVLERRDIEKRSRLERLEKAMARVDRLRALVNH